MNKKWLEQLELGQQVIVMSSGAEDCTATVQRLTKTLIVLETGARFNRATGRGVGEVCFRSFLVESTPEAIDRIAKYNLVRKLRHYDWKSLSPSVLRAVIILVEFPP